MFHGITANPQTAHITDKNTINQKGILLSCSAAYFLFAVTVPAAYSLFAVTVPGYNLFLKVISIIQTLNLNPITRD